MDVTIENKRFSLIKKCMAPIGMIHNFIHNDIVTYDNPVIMAW